MKKEVKKENINLRLSKSRKDSLQASAFRQGTTLSELIFSSLDTMRIKGIKDNIVLILDNMRHIEGLDTPNYDLKGGDDGGNKDLDLIHNWVLLMLDMTNGLNPINQGVKGAIRKANGDFVPQKLDGHSQIMKNIKRNGKSKD